jgi:predicted phage terminase large subunit-like protein
VFGPAWVWTFDPRRISCNTTYGGKLALKSARRMRDLVNSEWYRKTFPGVKIPYQNTHAAAFFENDAKGARFSGSVGGEITGNHFHDIGGDDLNKTKDARAPNGLELAAAWEFWSGDLATRQAEPSLTTKLQVGQRIHVDDVGGRWVREDPDVEVVCLPMVYESDHPYAHPDDPRKPGELLWPSRYDAEAIKEMEIRLGPSGAAAQLQQRPVPPGGYLIRPEYLEHRYSHLPSSMQRSLESGRAAPGEIWGIYADLTFKGKSTSDFAVFQLWCRRQGLYYLIDQIRGQWGFRETKRRGREFADRYRVASSCKLEDAANASAMEDDMKGEIRGLISIPHGGGCLARVQQVEGTWASGCVMLPESADWLGGSDGFVAEHLSYDGLGTRHDDQVSAASLALLDLSTGSASAYAEILKGLK